MSSISNLKRKLLYFAIFISPLGASVISIPIGGVQMSLLRMTIIVSLFLMLSNNSGKVIIYRSGNRYSSLFMLVWLAYALISVLWAINIGYWIKAVFFIFIGVASMLLFANSFTERNDIKKALESLNLGIAVQSLIGWYEIFTQDYRFVEKTQKWQTYYNAGFYREPVAMQGNSNDFGLLMFVGVFVALACFRFAKKRIDRNIAFILAVNYVVLTFLSGSRACIIGLMIGTSLYLFLQGFRKALLIVVPIGMIFAVPSIFNSLISTLHFNFNASGGSDVVRYGLLKTGIDYFVRTFGAGVGAGQVEAWVESKGSMYFIGSVTNLHNWWAEILAAYGVVIFVGYLVFYYRLFTCNYHILRDSQSIDAKYISLSLCSIMAGYVIASLSSSSNINSECLWLFWSLCIAYQGLGNNNYI